MRKRDGTSLESSVETYVTPLPVDLLEITANCEAFNFAPAAQQLVKYLYVMGRNSYVSRRRKRDVNGYEEPHQSPNARPEYLK